MQQVDSDQLREILIKGWMTHDGMWFRHCLAECGIERTNAINRRAVRDMAHLEAKRMLGVLGMDGLASFADLEVFVTQVSQILVADFMNITFELQPPNRLHCHMHSCWAHDGIKRLGVIDRYECGVFERISGWFQAMGLSFTVQPQVTGCMLHQQGKCHRTYTLDLGSGPQAA